MVDTEPWQQVKNEFCEYESIIKTRIYYALPDKHLKAKVGGQPQLCSKISGVLCSAG